MHVDSEDQGGHQVLVERLDNKANVADLVHPGKAVSVDLLDPPVLLDH